MSSPTWRNRAFGGPGGLRSLGILAIGLESAFSDSGARRAQLALDEHVMLGEMQARLLGDATSRPTAGRYPLCERMGHGAQAVLYRGRDLTLDREVAIKVFTPRPACARPSPATRREACALARLEHAHVVPVFDVGVLPCPGHEDTWQCDYLVLELVRGCSLAERLRQGPMAPHVVVDVLAKAGRGLAAAHARGLVHRDFKPANVLLSEDGKVRVGDFGLAVGVAGGMQARAGTPAYMAPEQHEGAVLDARADQYSFCVALYEAVCGALPFRADALDALLDAKRGGGPPGVCGPLAAVIRRGLSWDRGARYASMDALLAGLAECTPRERGRTRYRLAGLVAAAGLGLALALLGWGGGVASPARCELGAEAVWRGIAVELPGAGGGEAAAAVDRGLTQYARQWAEAYGAVCSLYAVDAPAADLQRACLQQRRAAVRDVVEGVGSSPGALKAAAEVVAQLPMVSACADLDALRAGLEPLGDGVQRAAVRDVRTTLKVVAGLVRQRRFAEALRLARPVVARAAQTDYGPAQADALRQLGALQGQLGLPDEASNLLQRAYFAARRSGDDAVAREAAIELVYVEGMVRGETELALQWAQHAAALVGEAPGAQLYLRTRLGQLYTHNGAYARARGELGWATAFALATDRRDQYAFAVRVQCRLELAVGALAAAVRPCERGAAEDPGTEEEPRPERASPSGHLGNAYGLEGLAKLRLAQGDRAAASEIFAQAAAAATRTRGAEHPTTRALRRHAETYAEPSGGWPR